MMEACPSGTSGSRLRRLTIIGHSTLLSTFISGCHCQISFKALWRIVYMCGAW
jgi:hypothetical protein